MADQVSEHAGHAQDAATLLRTRALSSLPPLPGSLQESVIYASIISAVVAAVVMYLAWRGFSRRPPSSKPLTRGGHPIALNPEEKVKMKLVEKEVGSYMVPVSTSALHTASHALTFYIYTRGTGV